MTELELVRKQRAILSDTLKEIATNNRTPSWISELCRVGVSKARALELDKNCSCVHEKKGEKQSPIVPGDIVRGTDPSDKCSYQVVSLSTTIDNVNLWNIRILKGDKNSPAGLIVNNVPENKISKN